MTAPRKVAMSGVGLNGKAYGLSYPLILSDGGRANSKRPKQTNDCTVRALALARHLSYDEAYEALRAAGRKCATGFAFAKWIDQQAWATKISFPAVKGQARMTPAAFVRQYPQGRYICKVAKHVFAVIDGVVWDTFENRPDRCIYSAWSIA